MKQVVLAKGRDRSVRRHHPWIFSGAIASGAAGLGETVEVVSSDGETLGYGSFSPESQIRLRMLSFDANVVPDAAFIESLVAASVARRADFFASDSATNACRLINAESDGLPGVVADYYNGHVVSQLTSAGAEFWKGTLVAALMKYVPNVRSVSARTDVDARRKEGLSCAETLDVLAGEPPPETIEIFEGAVKFFVDPRKGHKTGFYLDQRDARAAVAALARGREVLNCFSYTGGFGLAAAAGGATRVTQVDISAEAIALAKKNAELNVGSPRIVPMLAMTGDEARHCEERSDEAIRSVAEQTPRHCEEAIRSVAEQTSRHCEERSDEAIQFVEADVFKYLRTCRDAGRTFDLIILDPPKFAESKAHLMKASRGYKDINLLAMKLLRPGGILATFSCSGAMTTELFDKVLADAAHDAGRDFQIVARTRQGADHPVALAFPEGFYLKGVILRAI